MTKGERREQKRNKSILKKKLANNRKSLEHIVQALTKRA